MGKLGALEEKQPLKPHYLKEELETLLATDPEMWVFIQRGSLDGVWYWDLENKDEEWISPEVWHLLGYEPADMEHSPSAWVELIFPEDLKLAMENFEEHCLNPDHPYDQIVRYRHRNGSTVWVRCRGIAIRDKAGRPIRMLGAHNDVTAVKNAEQEAVREREKQRSANDDLQTFVYGISHDLISPSRTAQQLIEETLLCDGGNLSEEQSELLSDATKVLSRMQKLVSDVLTFGSIVEVSGDWTEVCLDEVIRETLEDRKAQVDKLGAVVNVSKLPEILGDKAQLLTLFQNLISNAIKYRRDGVTPFVEIHGRKENDGSVTVFVRDNGRGIPESHFDDVFKIFKRLQTYDTIPGSGIGLALCNRIAANHNAAIYVQSEVGCGSTFEVKFSSWIK